MQHGLQKRVGEAEYATYSNENDLVREKYGVEWCLIC